MLIRHGVAADAPVLAALARHTFFETFAETNDPGDMALHLERAYGVAQQAAELADPLIVTLLVEHALSESDRPRSPAEPALSEFERLVRSNESNGSNGSGGEAIGYAQLREGEVPECVTGRDAIELWRLYVRREWHGQGVAQALMARVLAEAAARGAATLWLGVWDQNPRAQAFYRKCGFVDVGEHVFLFGTDPQRDRVMEIRL